jgi:hypothetical protein
MRPKMDLCELNYQVNRLRDASKEFLKIADGRTFDPTDDGLTALGLKNKIRVGALAELIQTLNTATKLVARIREYPIDDLELDTESK